MERLESNETSEEFFQLMSNIDRFYIFGTGLIAKKILRLTEVSGENIHFMGYIISSAGGIPQDMGSPVFLLDEVQDKQVCVLVSVSEIYHPEVYMALREAGFSRIIAAHKFYSLDIKLEARCCGNDRFVDGSVPLSKELLEYRRSLLEKHKEYDTAFGGDRFYQSLPSLGILGQRPTEVRIREYGIERWISPDVTVLDIGCNCGFLDMEIACKVKSIVGVEYNKTLVDIGNATVMALKVNNIRFYCADYNSWQARNHETFDLIFSFAVHAWLNISPEQYALSLFGKLNKGGHLIFESQTLTGDRMFESFISALKQQGLSVVQHGIIKDDGITERAYVVFEKANENKSSIKGK